MGQYLNPPGVKPDEKSKWLFENGTPLDGPPKWKDVPADCSVICCVRNGPFEAAAVCYSPDVLEAFSLPDDPRAKSWFLLEKTKAAEVCHGLFG